MGINIILLKGRVGIIIMYMLISLASWILSVYGPCMPGFLALYCKNNVCYAIVVDTLGAFREAASHSQPVGEVLE